MAVYRVKVAELVAWVLKRKGIGWIVLDLVLIELQRHLTVLLERMIENYRRSRVQVMIHHLACSVLELLLVVASGLVVLRWIYRWCSVEQAVREFRRQIDQCLVVGVAGAVPELLRTLPFEKLLVPIWPSLERHSMAVTRSKLISSSMRKQHTTSSSPSASSVDGSGIGPSMTHRFDSYLVRIKFSIFLPDCEFQNMGQES